MFSDFAVLLRRRDFLLFTANGSLTSGVFFTFLGGAPYIAERILGLRPSVYGLWFALLPLGYASGSFLAGRFSQRIGLPRMILTGSVLSLGAVLVQLTLHLVGFSGAAALFLPMAVAAIGNGMGLPNAVSGAINVRPDIAGATSGLSGAAQLGTGAALSIIGSLMLTGGSSATPLLLIMTGAAALAVLTGLGILRLDPR